MTPRRYAVGVTIRNVVKNITARHRRFVQSYCEHFNGARAAREAGYAESRARITASELLADSDISEMVEERLEELSMSSAEATKRLTDQARATISDFFETRDTPEGEELILDHDALLQQGHLVKELRWDSDGQPVLKLYSAQKALKTLLEAHGAFNHDQRHEVMGKDGQPIEVIFEGEVPEPDDQSTDE